MTYTSIKTCGMTLIIRSKSSTVEPSREWIHNFIPHFTGHVITYPCLYWSWSRLEKGPLTAMNCCDPHALWIMRHPLDVVQVTHTHSNQPTYLNKQFWKHDGMWIRSEDAFFREGKITFVPNLLWNRKSHQDTSKFTLNPLGKYHRWKKIFAPCSDVTYIAWHRIFHPHVHDMHDVRIAATVLRIRGLPVAKYHPLLGWAIHHDPRSRPMGDPTLDKLEHD